MTKEKETNIKCIKDKITFILATLTVQFNDAINSVLSELKELEECMSKNEISDLLKIEVKDGTNHSIELIFENCKELLDKKNKEYTNQQDRFEIFKEAANIENITPEQSLWGFALKQITSISTMIQKQAVGNIKYSTDIWLEKCSDLINYLVLLFAMECEKDLKD